LLITEESNSASLWDLTTEEEEESEEDEFVSPIPAQAEMADLRRLDGEIDQRSKRFDKSIVNEIEWLRPTGRFNDNGQPLDYDIMPQNSTVRDINFAFLRNQARYFCVYSMAPLGVGKTSYGLNCLRQLYGNYDHEGFLTKLCDDWELLKAHIVFHPQSFKQIVQHLQKTRTRIKCLLWDDAGIFLASKDWQKAWAKEIVKYFQLARTYCASIILTTPSPSLILKDVRRLNMVTVNIEFTKAQMESRPSQFNARRAKSYDHWYLPDLTKPRIRYRGTDRFNVHLPDCIYKPYQEMRAGYADYELDKVFEIIGNEGLEMVGEVNYEKLAPSRS
jgi:hypothetical protein